MSEWTIKNLLDWVTGYLAERNVDSPRLSAEILLSEVLGLSRIQLYTNFDRVAGRAERDRLRELVKRAGEHEPIAYLVGRCEFYSLSLKVTPACMIPRPETEVLVERAIAFLKARTGRKQVLDLCTGCGPIATAIAANYPQAQIIATDISDEALQVAAENTATHKVSDRVRLRQGDLFEPALEYLNQGGFDLIVCNPPYVSKAEWQELDRCVRDYEPRSALYAGEDGLDVYRRIAAQAGDFLKSPEAALMLEIGFTQADAVRRILQQTQVFTEITIEKDLEQRDRVVTAKKISG